MVRSRLLKLTEVKRSGCQAIIINKSLDNFTNSPINETSLPSCPPGFWSSDLIHPFTSPVLLTRGQRVCNAVACAPPFRPQLVRAPLKGCEKETSPLSHRRGSKIVGWDKQSVPTNHYLVNLKCNEM